MEKQEISQAVSLKDLWSVFVRNIVVIALVGAAVTVGTFLVNRITTVPQYKSTATLYILRQDNESATTSSDFSLALNVVNDCTYFLKSHAVVDQVIDDLSLNMSYSQLRGCITTSNPESTRILEVSVVAGTPEQAKAIVDRVCEIGAEKIQEAMGFKQVRLYEYGILNATPSNTTGFLTFLVLGIVAAVLAYAVFLVIFLQDDKIHTDEDVERYLGLSILGDLPDVNEVAKGKSIYGVYGHTYDKKTTSTKQPQHNYQAAPKKKGM